ncbi:hypothetical protein QYE76_061537 [Lolium multiflorum]|uniref:F-box domain-containing protein n=1 Tax=Lolium multiflorum TaxID=4521 RepID=A0AAD8S1G2_LOLMU|nr:hypothetical protein QYE76_061537 [Lolium multiflorum]
MSTKLGVHKSNLPLPAAAPVSAREPLPMDLLLEIAARSDVTTIVRCARASKSLRGAILDPAFRRRLELQAAAAGGGGFDPALLFGVSYLTFGASMVTTHHIIHTPSSVQLHPCLQALTLDDSFQPVASRDRLLLLQRFGIFPHPPNIELRVFDTTTALVTCLPMVSTFNAHAFLSVTDGHHYELVIMDKRFWFEIFSSKRGGWSAARRASSIDGHPRRVDASSRVVGRTVHWLCQRNAGAHCWDGILALDVHAEQATTMKLPSGCLQSRMTTSKHDKHLLLGSVRGRLSLIVAEARAISMWTLTPPWSPLLTATWSRELVIGAEEIVRTPGGGCSPLSFVLEGFGERSGAVIVRVDGTVLLRLDLRTKAVTRLHNPGGDASVTCLFVHETDMLSLLKKSF